MKVWRISSEKIHKAYLSVFCFWNNSLTLLFFSWLNSFLVIKHLDKGVEIKIVKWFIYLKSLDYDCFKISRSFALTSSGWRWKWKWVTRAQHVSSSQSYALLLMGTVNWDIWDSICWNSFRTSVQLIKRWPPSMSQALNKSFEFVGDKANGCPSEETDTIQ